VVQGGDELGFAVVRHLKFLPHGLTRAKRISCDTIFRMIDYDENDVSECTRCSAMVGTETLVRRADGAICENCWDDL
jgi:hypothetical protein